MTATLDPTLAAGRRDGDPVTDYLAEVLSALAGVAGGTGVAPDAVRIDRIAVLERIQAAAAAAQAREIVGFAQGQVAAQRDQDVHPRRLGAGIAEQIALACRTSAWHGSRLLTRARDLVLQLPATFDLLTRGDISAYQAQLVATQTSHLSPADRATVDRQLLDAGIADMSNRSVEAAIKRFAYAADPTGALRRARRARDERHVSLRPAPDTMTWLSMLLPVEQGVACLAALTAATDSARALGDPRTRGQVMADTAVERLTGQSTAESVPIEVQLTMSLDSLLDPDHSDPALIPGLGPLPGALARELLQQPGGRKTWRRLFTGPPGWQGRRALVGGDPRARRFTGWLAQLIELRDQTCREPFCDAPIRHLDHISSWRDGGETSYLNGRGLCERHNYARQQPGWRAGVLIAQPHTTVTTTPTGHIYLSRAPDPP